jgi:hypothetical protein
MLKLYASDLTKFMDGKVSFDFEDFKKINQEFSSEMFLSIMIIL